MARQSRLSHLSNDELANMTAKDVAIQFYNGNIGAGYNALVARGIRPKAQDTAKNGDNGVKTVVARVTPIATAKSQESAKLALPGRIEDYLLDNILPETWDDNQEIPQHFVELIVLSDTPDWNKRVRRLGSDELTMLESFLGDKATMNRREDALLEKQARLPYELSQARIAAVSAIDTALENAASRFENSRYDSNIIAFYAE